jgi:outer membrane immunogenic protein
MTLKRKLMLVGLGASALAGAGLGTVALLAGSPLRADRVSLSMPPSLEMVAFDNEETVIDATFGPSQPLAQKVSLDDDGRPLAAPPQDDGDEPPHPQAAPVHRVEGPIQTPRLIVPGKLAQAPAADAAPTETTPTDAAPAAAPAPVEAPVSASPAMPGEVQATVRGLRVGHSGDKTRIIIDLSASTDFAYSVGKDGKTVSVVLPGAAWKAAPKGSTKSGGRITGYEYMAVDGGSKVILSASEPVDIIQVEPHPAGSGQGYQLVIDLVDNQGALARRGGLAFWWTKETPATVAEAPAPQPAPQLAPPPAPKVADAGAMKAEPLPLADYKKARDWSGFYAGLHTGYDWARAKEDHSVRGSRTATLSGPTGGMFLGWGKQYGLLYLGGELAGGYAGADAKQAVSGGKHTISKDWDYSAAMRVGMPVLDDGLIYLKGGYKAARFALDSNRPNDTPVSSVKDKTWSHGALVGGGMDYMVAENWFARVEGDYTWFKSMKYVDSNGDTGKISPKDINVRVGVAYKF